MRCVTACPETRGGGERPSILSCEAEITVFDDKCKLHKCSASDARTRRPRDRAQGEEKTCVHSLNNQSQNIFSSSRSGCAACAFGRRRRELVKGSAATLMREHFCSCTAVRQIVDRPSAERDALRSLNGMDYSSGRIKFSHQFPKMRQFALGAAHRTHHLKIGTHKLPKFIMLSLNGFLIFFIPVFGHLRLFLSLSYLS